MPFYKLDLSETGLFLEINNIPLYIILGINSSITSSNVDTIYKAINKVFVFSFYTNYNHSILTTYLNYAFLILSYLDISKDRDSYIIVL